jgi:murein DD-endopeptidase MepM/ murein hydrolase activator NlpD
MTARPTLLALLLAAAPAFAEPLCLDDANVCLEAREGGSRIELFAVNREDAPYSLRVLVTERSNLEPASPLPFRAVLEPGQEREVGALRIRDAQQPTYYQLRWNAAPGDARARHDDRVRYRMPFGGREPRTLAASGAGGFEFAMPWGTPVLAARGGRVVTVVDALAAGADARGALADANRVEVLHADGTLATYAYLRQGAAVHIGQAVATGDLLGWSGESGAAREPHLHFRVWKRDPDLSQRTLAVRFHDGSAAGFVPPAGLACSPGCASSGAGCAPGDRPAPEPALARNDTSQGQVERRADGACVCPNGAVIAVAQLSCERVCGR